MQSLQFNLPLMVNSPTGETRIILEDFSDIVLHDQAWLNTQSSLVSYVKPKGDSGSNELYLAPGQGRNGSNAMEVRAISASNGLPSFWLLRIDAKSRGRIIGLDKFFDYNTNANFLEIVFKFPSGLREILSSTLPAEYPNHQNVHVGTYHALEPNNSVENNNWHYYYQLWFRHDLAQNDWIVCRCGLDWGPTHQRSNVITSPPGNFWGQLTRLYFECVPYFDTPEINYPFSMYVDEIALVQSSLPEWQDVSNETYKQMTIDSNIERRWHRSVL